MRATKKTAKSLRVPDEVRALLKPIETDPIAIAQVVELVDALTDRSRFRR